MPSSSSYMDSVDADLAISGGQPVRTRPFPPWPYIAEEEIEAAVAVLRSGRVNYWTGEQGREFEREFAASTECKRAIALANGTVALELALHALGIGPGDEVVVPSRTFIASAACVVMRRAKPVFADVDPVTQTITAKNIEQVLTRRTKAIIVVHLAGWPCDMDPIMSLARERGLKVIEDCAQAQGAKYNGRPVGSLGDAGAFSFCQDKIMTTGGEGGMLTTNDEELWSRAWSFKDHGKDYVLTNSQKHSAVFRWVHKSIGTNWRMTEMQSAMGRVLLTKLPGFIERRRANAAILNEALADIEALRLTPVPVGVAPAYYKYYAFLRPEYLANGWTRDRVLEAINAEGIPCYGGTCSEIYLEDAFVELQRPRQRLKIAKELGDTSLMFLVHPTLSSQEMQDTAMAVKKVMQVASISYRFSSAA